MYAGLWEFELPVTGAGEEMGSPRPEKGKWGQNQDSTWCSVLKATLLLFVYIA